MPELVQVRERTESDEKLTTEVVEVGPVSGPQGPQGPQGPEGTTQQHTHNQLAAATDWTVQHNFGVRPGGVMAVDSLDREIVGDVEHLDENSLIVRFTVAVAGRVYVT